MDPKILLPKDKLPKNKKSYVLSKAENAKKIIILSPHLDDAVVSMGNFLSHMETFSIPIQVVSVFTKGANISHSISEKLISQGKHTSVKEYFEERISEDKKVLSQLKNVKSTHLNFIDCVWRTDKNGSIFYKEKYLSEIHKDDLETKRQLLNELRNLEVNDAVIFAPIAHGKHVDHQLVRNAATEAFPEVIYYSDFPYSVLYDHEYEFIKKYNLKSEVIHTNNYEKKRELIMGYKSQYGSFFKRGDVQLVLETFYFK